jgi:predicted phosphoadenosine phosphosulfate sulfurtransferase
LREARKRGRQLGVFFLDQEAEYSSTVDLMVEMMSQTNVEPMWYQVPLYLTNVTSYSQDMFYAWDPDGGWIREKHPLAIKHIDADYPERFYPFFQWKEKGSADTAFLVGLRAEESLNRLRAVVQNPGWEGVRWSTKTAGKNSYRFYPIYDWTMGDVWRYIHEEGLPYNVVYDRMFRGNRALYKTMRVSNLVHEKSFKCLADLQEFEPETFDKLAERIPGIRVAALYGHENSVFDSKKLPGAFSTWRQFRDYLLDTTPVTRRGVFEERFKKQGNDEEMCRRQVRQIMLNDHENSLKVEPLKKKNRENLMKWWDVL